MSDFRGHFRGGLIGAALVILIALIFKLIWNSLSWVEFPLVAIICILGALWPDTDIGSTSRRLFYGVLILIAIPLILFHYYLEAAILGLLAMFPAISKHRGFTHSAIWAFIVGLPLLIPSYLSDEFLVDIKVYEYRNLIFFGLPYYLAFLAGTYSHLILDRKKPKK